MADEIVKAIRLQALGGDQVKQVYQQTGQAIDQALTEIAEASLTAATATTRWSEATEAAARTGAQQMNAAVAAMTGQLGQWNASVDRTAAETARLAEITGTASAAIKRELEGAAASAQAQLDRIVASSGRAGQSARQLGKDASEAGGVASRDFREGVRNAGYQIQDFAVQVSMGTDATRALSMQLPQLLGGFGVWGAVVGAAVAVAGGLITALWQSKDAADAFKEAQQAAADTAGYSIDSIDKLTESYRLLNEQQAITARQKISDAIDSNTAVIEDQRKALADALAMFTKYRDTIESGVAAGGAMPRSDEDLNRLEQLKQIFAEIDRLNAGAPVDQVANALRNIVNQMPDTDGALRTTKLGITGIADTAQTAAQTVARLREQLAEIPGGIPRAPSANAGLSGMGTPAGNTAPDATGPRADAELQRQRKQIADTLQMLRDRADAAKGGSVEVELARLARKGGPLEFASPVELDDAERALRAEEQARKELARQRSANTKLQTDAQRDAERAAQTIAQLQAEASDRERPASVQRYDQLTRKGGTLEKATPDQKDEARDLLQQIEGQKRHAQAAEESRQAYVRLREEYDPVAAKAAAYREELSQIDTVTRELGLSQEEHRKLLEGLAVKYDDTASAIKSAFTGVSQIVSQSLANMAESGEFSVKRLLKSIEALAIQRVFDATLGRVLDTGAQALGNALSGMWVSSSTPAPTTSYTELAFRASGGPIDPMKPYVVGEKGPELIVPKSAGTVVPNSALGGDVNIQIIDNRSGNAAPAQVERQRGGPGVKDLVRITLRDMAATGELDGTLGTAYQLNRQLVAR